MQKHYIFNDIAVELGEGEIVMKKRASVLLLLIISVIFLTIGCLASDKEGPGKKDIGVLETELTVVDHLNRKVTITKVPEKIVSGYYISTSALIALGMEDQIVGIEAKANTRPIYSLAAPQLLDLPNVGTAKEFDLEGCIALHPDLVILPIKLKDQIKTLEDMGITVIGVNPENQQLLEEMITMIAQITRITRDEELFNYYKDKEDELSQVHTRIKEKPKVYLAGNSDLLSTATKKMYQNDVIESAGGVNVANNINDSYWANISYEQLIEYNPDYIIIVPEAKYKKEDIMNDNNLKEIGAIKNKNVYKMPNEFEAWDSPVPSSILGKIWLTAILHKEEYPYSQFVSEVYNFYNQFYDFKVDKEILMLND